MYKNSLLLGFFLSILVFLASCNKDTSTSTTSNNTTITGTWNLTHWDGAIAAGTMVFTSNTLNFNSTSPSFNETTSYTVSGNKYTFTKTGGSNIVISGGSDWTMDTLTSNLIFMTSKYGLKVRATR